MYNIVNNINNTYLIGSMGIFFVCNSFNMPASSDGDSNNRASPVLLYLTTIKDTT